jgi:death-on-curing protein
VPKPNWVRLDETLASHDLQLVEHGGAPGVRDLGLLESALARPKNLFAYSDDAASLPRLAAAYAVGIVKNHPLVDGNKRTALVMAACFLALNGVKTVAAPEECYLTFLAVAAGEMTEDDLAAWFDEHSSPL